jgi:2-polyprenyl-6-methoxyphenol hydroxylase-like FAD-dependent oxidoreductase
MPAMARVVVVGGGIGGLACALFLAPRGHDVTILDRDPADLPTDRDAAWVEWERRGVPQFRHIHLFNARGRNLLRDEAPEVFAALRAAGAGEIRLGDGDDDDLVRLTCRRTTYELVLRRAVLSDSRVRFLGGVTVTGLCAAGRRITGVRAAGGTEWAADVVVDASGRRSQVAAWLADVGLAPPLREEQEEETVAYTRWYRLRSETSASLLRADLGYTVGVVAPADDGVFCVTFGCLAEDRVMRALREPAAFDAAVAAIPPLAAWTAPDRVTVESGVLAMADRTNRRVRLMRDGTPVAAGLVLLGDSAMCTNPGYGRGVGLALVHAWALAQVLEDAGEDPEVVTPAFEDFTRTELEPWYRQAVAGDRVRLAIGRRVLAGEALETIGGDGDDAAVRFARAAPLAVERDPVVRRASHRAFQLLDPPSSFWGNPDIEARVEAVWRGIEGSPPPAPGPDHATMAALLAHPAGQVTSL